MKLNPDCIRDILLRVEEETSYGKQLVISKYESERTEFLQYKREEIFYHLEQCKMGYLIDAVSSLSEFEIYCLTPKGHEFIENIRQDTSWNQVKTVSKQLGVYSLNALFEISISLISDTIKKHLGL